MELLRQVMKDNTLGQIISAALLSDTIDKGGITVKPNVKYRSSKKLTSDNIVVDSTCDFTATADAIDMAERVLGRAVSS